MVGSRAADGVFDLVKRRDAQERLVDDGRALLRRGLDQLSPTVSPAERQRQRLAALAVRFGQVAVATIGVNLNGAVEAVEDLVGELATAPGAVVEDDARRQGTSPSPVSCGCASVIGT